jgi:LysM repeat protein/lipoprotein-anchoring transpeptidase ErfK/SrfK
VHLSVSRWYTKHPFRAKSSSLPDTCEKKFIFGFASGDGIRLKLEIMLFGAARPLLMAAISGIFAIGGSAQTTPEKPAALKRIEPGLENAVKWEWHVEPSENWVPSAPSPTPTPVVTALPTPENRPTVYEVKHGDALVLIGKKFGLTVSQLQSFNGLKGDTIRIGQKLKIPTVAEVSAMAPPVKKHKSKETPEAKSTPEAGTELDKLMLQVFLDREQFSAGPIVGDPGPPLTKVQLLYQSTHEDAKDDASLGVKAKAAVANVFTQYKLKAEDFRFIAPPKAETVEAKPTPPSSPPRLGKPTARSHAIVKKVPLTYEDLISMPMLAYRTPWEFVSERFHCQESYLRKLNEKLPAIPTIGTEFRVPNVVPFEIEKAFEAPIQPEADPKHPVTAAVIGLSQLNIYQDGALVAVLPVSPARPGLHGRNSWQILDVIPHPRLATFQKPRNAPPQKAGSPVPITSPEPTPPSAETDLAKKEYLAAGPRNPVGIFWINLAKSNTTEPLPYGLTGTSIPDQMNIEESIGGFRLTNWDIARAVRRLPLGTPLQWK